MKTSDEEVADLIAEITRTVNSCDDRERASAATIKRAGEWIVRLFRECDTGLWVTPHVGPDPGGEVTFEWWNGTKKLDVFVSDSAVEYIKSWGTNVTSEMKSGDATQGSHTELLRWLRGEETGTP